MNSVISFFELLVDWWT